MFNPLGLENSLKSVNAGHILTRIDKSTQTVIMRTGQRFEAVVGMQLSEKKFIVLLQRKGFIPDRLSVDDARNLFGAHSRSRQGFLKYEEFRELMGKLYSAFQIEANNIQKVIQSSCCSQFSEKIRDQVTSM